MTDKSEPSKQEESIGSPKKSGSPPRKKAKSKAKSPKKSKSEAPSPKKSPRKPKKKKTISHFAASLLNRSDLMSEM